MILGETPWTKFKFTFPIFFSFIVNNLQKHFFIKKDASPIPNKL